MPGLLRKLWREQRPDGEEQFALNFQKRMSLALPVPLFDSEK
jgi:hypothetical protein